eukprot:TRINITY_DN8038_c0_g1_i3.p1 TRINITY_DN8038_c0_g1~~TRINITY_DN8038_c0_g1_i3.p1  ORF type:complete len:908 (+),score=95.27 TRINITY_DN8038_c0_g1_i3:280-2724(+)
MEPAAETVSTLLRKNNVLKEIVLSRNRIEHDGAKALGDVLRSNTTLQTLDLSRNTISSSGARNIFCALFHNTALTSIDLTANRISSSSAPAAAELLRRAGTVIRSIELGENPLTDDWLVPIADELRKNTSLQNLGLYRCGLSNDSACALAFALLTNRALTRIDLGANNISDKGATKLAAALKRNTNIVYLDLHENRLHEESAAALSAVFPEFGVKTLIIAKNQLESKGAEAIATNLSTNTSLTVLDLSANLIGDSGLEKLMTAIAENKSITTLKLASNKFENRAATHIASALQKNSTLLSLYLQWNDLGARGAKTLGDALQTNNSLTHLDIRGNWLSDAGTRSIAHALRTNTSLKSLILSRNYITESIIGAFKDLLACNRTVTNVDLSANTIDQRGVDTLEKLFAQSHSVKTYSLKDNAARNVSDDRDRSGDPRRRSRSRSRSTSRSRSRSRSSRSRSSRGRSRPREERGKRDEEPAKRQRSEPTSSVTGPPSTSKPGPPEPAKDVPAKEAPVKVPTAAIRVIPQQGPVLLKQEIVNSKALVKPSPPIVVVADPMPHFVGATPKVLPPPGVSPQPSVQLPRGLALRIAAVLNENLEILSPIGPIVEGSPVLSLLDAIKRISPPIPYINQYLFTAFIKARVINPTDLDAGAALALYCDEWPDTATGLPARCNAALAASDREELRQQWAPFIKILLRAFQALAPYSGPVYRAAPGDIAERYPEGRRIFWYQFGTCLTAIAPLEAEPALLGSPGPRALFAITASSARRVTGRAADQILLPPSTYFEVAGHLKLGQLSIIHLEELPSPLTVLSFEDQA